MAVGFLACPVKTTTDVDLAKPLKKFINETFADTKPEDYERSLTDFQRLRTQACNKFMDKHETAIEAVSRYYDQLCAVESKLPMTEDQIRLNFKWYDAFDKGSLIGGKASLTIPLGSFEKACILFNIGALQSQVASVQSRDSDEGLKLSAKLFQQSAGALKHLRDNVMSYLGRDPTADIHPDTLNAISALMLAQAQESIYTKASKDGMKDAIVAKIAMQCSDLYSEALKLLQMYSVRDIWPKDWVIVVAGKQASFHGLAEYYQSGVAKGLKNYGEEIARLQHAKELTQAAITRGGKEIDCSVQMNKIDSALTSAKKDNDFIYHDKIPEMKSLPLIGKAVIAKPLPIGNPMSNNFKDLFEKLVPLAIHNALAGYDSRKSQLVNMEVGRLREATQTMNGILASLNLPAAIEDVSGTDIPASVKEKAEKVQAMGGVHSLNKLIAELPDLLQRNKEILDESSSMLDEEAASDMQLKEQHGEKWNRTPSYKLTEGIRTEGAKYKSIIDNAVHADGVVKEKYNTHSTGFNLLSKPVSEIKAALPSANPVSTMKDSGAVKQLRTLCGQIDAMKAEREVTESELKNATSDMTTKFMAALAADGAIDEEGLSSLQLQTTYGPFSAQVNDSLARQEQILAQLQSANTTFCQEKASDQSGVRREEMLRELAAAFDAYVELKGNLEEGTKFYNDLTQILVKYQNKISDLCFARKTEKEELMKDLNQQIAARPTQPAPQAPNYQKPAPARPPPPVPTTSAANTQAAPAAAATAASAPAAAASAPTAPAAAPQVPYPMSPYPAMQYPAMPTGYNPYAQPGYSQPGYYQQPAPPMQSHYPPPGQQQPGYPPQGSYPQQNFQQAPGAYQQQPYYQQYPGQPGQYPPPR